MIHARKKTYQLLSRTMDLFIHINARIRISMTSNPFPLQTIQFSFFISSLTVVATLYILIFYGDIKRSNALFLHLLTL